MVLRIEMDTVQSTRPSGTQEELLARHSALLARSAGAGAGPEERNAAMPPVEEPSELSWIQMKIHVPVGLS